MEQNWQIKDKNVLITGGASGIGAANVVALLQEGVKQIAILDTAEEAARSLIERCKPDSNKILFKKCDVSDEGSLTMAFEEVVNVFKTLDVIINCAGILDDSPDNWSRECDINLKAVVSLTFKGINHMGKDKGGFGGTIVNIASIAGLMRLPYMPVYSATKSGVIHFGRCISDGDFFERTSVRILTICYSGTTTGITHNLENKGWNKTIGQSLAEVLASNSYMFQKVESAAQAFIEMLKTGYNGSIWVSSHDMPVKDITSIVESTEKCFESLVVKEL